MGKFGPSIVFFLCTAVTTMSMVTAQSCNAGHRQLTNVKNLYQVIDDQVNFALKQEPRKLIN